MYVREPGAVEVFFAVPFLFRCLERTRCGRAVGRVYRIVPSSLNWRCRGCSYSGLCLGGGPGGED
jgi:hypothetical protein